MGESWTPPSSKVQTDPLGVALGTQFEPYPAGLAAPYTAPTTQNVFAVAIYATAGAVITGIKLRNAVAAAGTLPTTARFGLADNTGKILALSGNVNALASWPTGVCPFTLTTDGGTTKYVTAYSGVYFPCFVVNGTWGTTQPTPALVNLNAAAMVADGTNPPVNVQWAGQTDLPAVGASLTMTTASARSYWMGVY